MGFELREHTADVAIAATGPTLGAVFAAVADGMAAAMCDGWPPSGERFRVNVSAESREGLLFDFLDEMIYQRDVRKVLPVEHDAEVEHDDEWRLEATARGVPVDEIDAREIKAVTYSEMALTEHDDGWEAYVVFDV